MSAGYRFCLYQNITISRIPNENFAQNVKIWGRINNANTTKSRSIPFREFIFQNLHRKKNSGEKFDPTAYLQKKKKKRRE